MLYGELNTIILENGETLHGLKVQIPHPKKSALIRRPTDKELDATRDKFRKLVKKNPTNTDKTPYLDLFNTIRLDDGAEWDEYEAEHIIGWVIQAQVESAETVNEELVVTIKTPTGSVKHFLRFPTFKEMQIKTGSALFDVLFLRSEGYAPDTTIPNIHRELSVQEVMKEHLLFDPYVATDPNA
ncbi:MAG TPA: hypothetical protein VGN17_00420 [Bryobacteraceae bacterium]|jgi:hypothetical protein